MSKSLKWSFLKFSLISWFIWLILWWKLYWCYNKMIFETNGGFLPPGLLAVPSHSAESQGVLVVVCPSDCWKYSDNLDSFTSAASLTATASLTVRTVAWSLSKPILTQSLKLITMGNKLSNPKKVMRWGKKVSCSKYKR